MIPVLTWSLDQEPTGSTASLSINGVVAHFTADIAGEYRVRVRAAHAAGDFAETTYIFDASAPPAAVLIADSGATTSGSFSAFAGYQIVLDGSHSTGPVGDALSKLWVLTSRPVGSAAQLSAQTGEFSNFIADKAGTYVVTLSVRDLSTSITSTYTETISVSIGPTAQITGALRRSAA